MAVEDREKYLTCSGRACRQKKAVEDREKYQYSQNREKYLIILVGFVGKKWP